MMLKHTLKLTFSNFLSTWKLLLYRIVCVLCVLGLTTVVAWPIINALIKGNFFVNLQASFEGVLFNLNIEKLFLSIDTTVKNFISIVSESGYMFYTIIVLIVDVILFVFLETYAKMAVTESVNGFMGSLTKFGFANSFILNLGKASLLSLVKLISDVPLTIAIVGGCYAFASGLYGVLNVFSIILAMLILIVLIALKCTFFSGWLPAVVIHNENVFSAFGKGLQAVFKRFFRTFSNYLIIVIACLILNMFALTLTAGVALLIAMPLTTLVCIIANQVMFYEAMGMRFYVDADTIISPKKLEQQDKFKDVKHII